MRVTGGPGVQALAAGALLSVFLHAGAAEEPRQSAPLVIANRTIVVLRGPIAGYTAQERVKNARERIEGVLESKANPTVTLRDEDHGTRVLIGGANAFVITGIDIDTQAGETTQFVAREVAKRLERAIVERRDQETPRYLAIAAIFSAVATLIHGLVLWLIFRATRWLGGRLSAAAASHSGKLQVGGIRLLDSSQVWLFTRRTLTLIAWVVGLLLATGWLTFVLEQFPYTRPWGESLEGNLVQIVKDIALAIVGAVPGLLLVVFIVFIARAIIRLSGVFFDRVESGRLDVGWIDPDTARPTRRILIFVIWVFALAMAYPYLPGAQTEAFKGLSVLVGIMVTIGGASVVGQAFSGLTLMYIKAFRRGDYVRIGETEGTVLELGMFATRVRTGLGEEITIPSSTIMTASIKNYSRAVEGTGYVVDTTVTIGYSTPWRQVAAMLEEAARRTANIAKTPPPMVRQTALADFYVEYRLIAYTPVERPAQRVEVLHQLHASIQDVFNEYGVQIMSPHYMTDPAEPHVVPKARWHAPPARPADPKRES